MKFLQRSLKQSKLPGWARYLRDIVVELVLIIAGILIALHFSNNKEARGKEDSRKQYVTMLIEDLQKDKRRLESCLAHDSTRVAYAKAYLQDEEAVLTGEMLWFFLHTLSTIAHDATYQSMIANNALGLIGHLGTQKALTEYYSSLKYCQRFEYWYVDHQFAGFLNAVGNSTELVTFMRSSKPDMSSAAIQLSPEQQRIVDGHILFAEQTSELEVKRYRNILHELNSLTYLLEPEHP